MRWTNWAALVAGAILALGWSASSAAAQEPDGAALYRQNCRSCHGGTGVPPARMITLYPTLKTLADSAFLRGRSVDSIAAVIRRGAGKEMKPFADRLSPAEIRAIATFVKALGTK
jgi:cytochrome c oxidase cbb3-type subunit III